MNRTDATGGSSWARNPAGGPSVTAVGRNRPLPGDDELATEGAEQVAEAGLLVRRRQHSREATDPW